jgi:hypothetical protein
LKLIIERVINHSLENHLKEEKEVLIHVPKKILISITKGFQSCQEQIGETKIIGL